MKKILLGLILVIVLIGCEKNVDSSEIETRKDGIVYIENSTKPYTGSVNIEVPIVGVEYKAYYKNGIKDEKKSFDSMLEARKKMLKK